MLGAVTSTKITKGRPIVNNAFIVSLYDDVALIDIDLRSKHCKVEYTFISSDNNISIGIVETDESMFLDKNCEKDTPTEIMLSDFNGWRVFCYTTFIRYTLRITLFKTK